MSHPTWKWTLLNYTEEDVELHRLWAKDMKRLRVAKEICPTTGTPHLQCAGTFGRNMRRSALKKMHNKIHWEPAKVEDFLYEAKEGSEIVIEVDNRKQGKRTDLEDIKKMVVDGASKKALWEKHWGTMTRCYRGVYEGMTRLTAPSNKPEYQLSDFPNWEPMTWEGKGRDFKSWILQGPSNIGKTEFAKAHFENPLVISHVDELKLLEDHDGIIFDDMNFEHWPRSAQIHLVDNAIARAINVKHDIARIPAYTRKVFTRNPWAGIFDLEDDAIITRVSVREVTKR